MSMGLAEMVNLVKSQMFEVIGYVALRVAQALDDVDIADDGSIDPDVRQALEVKKKKRLYTRHRSLLVNQNK